MTAESAWKRPWSLIVAGVLAAGAVAVCLMLAGPTILHGRQIAGTPTASTADVAAVKVERKAAADAQDLARLEAETRADLQRYWDDPANNRGWRIVVVSVSLVKVGENKYEGMVTMTADGGPQKDVGLHVTADGRKAIWNTDPFDLTPGR